MPFVDNMDIKHRPGKSIPHADCLTRNMGSGTSQPDAARGTVGESLTTWAVELRVYRAEIASWEPADADRVEEKG